MSDDASVGRRGEPDAADDPLRSLLRPDLLRRCAGDRIFERGRRYAAEGRVAALRLAGSVLHGTVRGTHDYDVRLWAESSGPAAACDCPMGEDGGFCKHAVALGMAWLNPTGEPAHAGAAPIVPPDDRPAHATTIRTYLDGLGRAALVDLILAQTERDGGFRERVALRATASMAPGTAEALARRAIDRATRTHGFVRYREAGDFAAQVHGAIDLVEEVLRAGQAAAVIELCEHALVQVEQGLASVDDSDGEMGGLLARLQDLHLAACESDQPEPVELAGRLFEWELHGEWDVFHGAVSTYAAVLGPAGLAEYRRLAEAEWASVPALGPGSDDTESFDSRRFRITSMMESLARAANDTDSLLLVMSRDLSSPYRFLQVARALESVGREDDALDWAERGVATFTPTLDGRLREYLAELYHRRSRHEDAVDLLWTPFARHPTVDGYQLLKAHAAGAGTWDSWRSRAIDAVQTSVRASTRGQAPRPPGTRFNFGPDGSILVRIHIIEGDVDAAWAAAGEFGCAETIWQQLASVREAEHPADAIPVHQRRVDSLLRAMRNDAYADAVDLLGHIRQLMERTRGDFPGYLASVLASHGRKRNFVKLLEGAPWRR